jgi:hypothetical protein
MDIFSHILWTYVPFRNKLWRDEALFFAILPDVGFLFILLFVFVSDKDFANAIPIMPEFFLIIYSTLHSFVALGVMALIVWKLRPKLLPALSGWFIHIMMDIPFHEGTFGTRFLYPLFPDLYLPGITWLDYRVLAISFLALVLVYVYSLRRERKKHLSGKDWKPDWIDKLHLMADGLINRKRILIANAEGQDIERTPDRISGEDRAGTGQGEDRPAEPLVPQDRG